jgi:pimeloyl-ACP methyl ester carboxylesterase
MTIHLIHGIHTQGASPVEGLIPFLSPLAAIKYPDYGYILGVETRVINPVIVGALLAYIEPGDILVGHSNGAAVAYDLMRAGAPVEGMVFVNAAVEQTIVRQPPCKWIDVYFNPGDEITEAAKLGQELGVVDKVWGEMGHAGYKGSDPGITNFNCGSTPNMPVVSGHSDFFTPSKLEKWGPFLADRIKTRMTS